MSQRIRFGEFEFDPSSGELRKTCPGGAEEVQRLPPQPAQLLTLLLEKRGELLPREDIRTLLWPDVQVDFEQGLHFCVRQVRSALGDSASQPRYVENLPRRGYRILPPVEFPVPEPPPVELEPEAPKTPLPKPALPRARPLAIAVVLGTLLTTLLVVRALFFSPTPVEPTLRLAITTFGHLEDPDLDKAGTPIADALLVRLTGAKLLATPEDPDRSQPPPLLGVLGPATTIAYRSGEAPIRRLIKELEVDYVLHGRFIVTDDGQTALLAELIRATDGVHVWVEAFVDLSEPGEISRTIASGVAATLDLELPPNGGPASAPGPRSSAVLP